MPNVRKVEDVLDDEKSEASYFSMKTNKTIRGKAFDKHCPLCEFKLIRGDYWARHRKMVHKDVEVVGMKCNVGCLQCKSKYLILFKKSHLVPKARTWCRKLALGAESSHFGAESSHFARTLVPKARTWCRKLALGANNTIYTKF